MKSFFYILITIFLIKTVFAQASSSGSSSDSSGSSKKAKAGCPYTCKFDPICIQQCQKKNKIIFGSINGCLGLIIIIVLSCLLWSRKGCWCHQYQNLRRINNNVENQQMPIEQFISKRDHFIQNLKLSAQQNNYYFYQKESQQYMHITDITIVKEQKPLLTNIKIQGNDDIFGTWSALGYILSKNNQIFLWFYKEYQYKSKAGQTGQYKYLIHETTDFNINESISGKWYYKGFEYSDDYSGIWRLDHLERDQMRAQKESYFGLNNNNDQTAIGKTMG